MYITKQYRFSTMLNEWMNEFLHLKLAETEAFSHFQWFESYMLVKCGWVCGVRRKSLRKAFQHFPSLKMKLHQWNKAENHPRAILYTFYIILNDRLIFFLLFSIFKLMKKNFYFCSFFLLNCKEIPLKKWRFSCILYFFSILNRNHHLKLKICFVSFPKQTEFHPSSIPSIVSHTFFYCCLFFIIIC